MSNGGVFCLSVNNGSMDAILVSNELLYKRIKHIRCQRQRAGQCNTAPTLRDIERSHVLFVNAHFKPFASICQEYQKERSQSGTAQFGGSVQFSISQYGDFWADMAGYLELDSFSASSLTLTNASADFPDLTVQATAEALLPEVAATGSFTGSTFDYVDRAGVVIATNAGVTNAAGDGAVVRNYAKYCDYPGLRILERVRFSVNGNPLDRYDFNDSIFYKDFLIPEDKTHGFNTLVGQENPIPAHHCCTSVDGSSQAPFMYSADSDTSRRLGAVVNGPQTPKAEQPTLQLYVPHWFWFCKDTRLAMPSVSIPYGQRFIEWDLATQDQIQFVVPGCDVFVRQTALTGVTGSSPEVRYHKFLIPGSVLDTTNCCGIRNVCLYVNNLFMQSEVHDIFIDRVGFNLIRVHRQQNTRLTAANTETLMSQLKWPIETIYGGVRPVTNLNAANRATQWHKMGAVTEEQSDIFNVSYTDPTDLNDATLQVREARDSMKYELINAVFDTVKVEAHGNTLISEVNRRFLNAYIPFQFGGPNIITPKDEGVFMINFALYPGAYQPSGYLNISRAREFYISINDESGNGITANSPADLLVMAVAINFILISDGSAVIRYST